MSSRWQTERHKYTLDLIPLPANLILQELVRSLTFNNREAATSMGFSGVLAIWFLPSSSNTVRDESSMRSIVVSWENRETPSNFWHLFWGSSWITSCWSFGALQQKANSHFIKRDFTWRKLHMIPFVCSWSVERYLSVTLAQKTLNKEHALLSNNNHIMSLFESCTVTKQIQEILLSIAQQIFISYVRKMPKNISQIAKEKSSRRIEKKVGLEKARKAIWSNIPLGSRLFFLVQVIFGIGLPVAEHSNRTGDPFFTCRCPPDVTWFIFGGTELIAHIRPGGEDTQKTRRREKAEMKH